MHDPNLKIMVTIFAILAWFYCGFIFVIHIGSYIFSLQQIETYNLLEFIVLVANNTYTISFVHKILGIIYICITVVIIFYLIRKTKHYANNNVARKIGKNKQIDFVLEKQVKEKSKLLAPSCKTIGLRLAKTVDNEWIYCGWEGSMIDIWGPRTGKTTTRAIPLIFDAPGAILVTSNKRDIVDDTAGFRALKTREQVWVYDPQNVCGTHKNGVKMYYDPLSYVTSPSHAIALANIMKTASKDGANGGKNDYFEISGPQLVACLLSVAALSNNHTIIDCFEWVNAMSDNTPVHIMGNFLKNASLVDKQKWEQTYNSLKEFYSLPQAQQAGVFGTAKTSLSWLINTDIHPWITSGEGRKQFVPEEFVSSNQSLYLMSYEGTGCATALITAFTNAVMEAAEKYAVDNGGRMPIPLVCVLDEAANVCKLETLPKLYSHYGSRGIVVSTILQSWKQGCNVWGENGMQALWDAAFFKTYGGAVADTNFHKMLSEMIGVEYVNTVSYSHGNGSYNKSVNYSSQQRNIMDVAALAQLDRGKIIMLAQTKMIMAYPQPWYELKEFKIPLMQGKNYYDSVQGNIQLHSKEFMQALESFDLDSVNIRDEFDKLSDGSDCSVEKIHSVFKDYMSALPKEKFSKINKKHN